MVAFGSLVFIISRPFLWEGALMLELALSRIGVLLCFVIFFLDGMVSSERHKSYVHKLSSLTYGVILGLGLVGVAGFWGL